MKSRQILWIYWLVRPCWCWRSTRKSTFKITSWNSTTDLTLPNVKEHAPIARKKSSTVWLNWAQSTSMASCLITNPGNSANTDLTFKAKQRSYPWTNKQTFRITSWNSTTDFTLPNVKEHAPIARKKKKHSVTELSTVQSQFRDVTQGRK